MAKKITGYVKLQVPAGSANPSPPIGPALGQRGLNIMEFCKAFNAKTQDQEKGMPIPVTITVFSDKSFTFEMKTAPASFFLKKAAKLTSGSKSPGITSAGSVTRAQVRRLLGIVRLERFSQATQVEGPLPFRRAQWAPSQLLGARGAYRLRLGCETLKERHRTLRGPLTKEDRAPMNAITLLMSGRKL